MRQMYFITSTVNAWKSLFHRAEFAEIIIRSLSFMITNERIKLHGYVIMPNHLHLILTINEQYALSSYLRDFHKYTAYEIIKLFKESKCPDLALFEVKKNDRAYQIWQETHAPKTVQSYKFFRQKLEYIHNNPLSARWRLCERPERYPYSSAGDYLTNKPGLLRVEKIVI
ncbi:MAG: transposase [Nitrospinae bacterium]|nr:transposase [Nitrospinota bacterium]